MESWIQSDLSDCGGCDVHFSNFWSLLQFKRSIPPDREAIKNHVLQLKDQHLSRLSLYLFSGSFVWIHRTEALSGLDSAQRDLDPEAFWKRDERPKVASWKSIHQSEWISSSTYVDRSDEIGEKKREHYCNIGLRAIPGKTAHPSFKLQHSRICWQQKCVGFCFVFGYVALCHL